MSALATDIRKLIARHIEQAPAAQVLQFAQRILDDDQVPPSIAIAAEPTLSRFVRLGEDGRPATSDSQHWVAVYDHETKLVWLADAVEGGERPWKESCEAAAAVTLFGATWRAPTIQEQLSIIDYRRFDPAVDTKYFRGPFGWTWTSSSAAGPAGYAWLVRLFGGLSCRHPQSLHYFVRAVCASQQLGLRF